MVAPDLAGIASAKEKSVELGRLSEIIAATGEKKAQTVAALIAGGRLSLNKYFNKIPKVMLEQEPYKTVIDKYCSLRK